MGWGWIYSNKITGFKALFNLENIYKPNWVEIRFEVNF